MRRIDVGTMNANGICNRFGATMRHEFNQVGVRRNVCMSRAALQVSSEKWVTCYKALRTHQQKMCCGCTAMAALADGKRFGNKFAD